MYEVDKPTELQKILLWIGRITRFPVVTSYGLAQAGNHQDRDAGMYPDTEQCCSGGYNEAFVFEYWVSYGPRH